MRLGLSFKLIMAFLIVAIAVIAWDFSRFTHRAHLASFEKADTSHADAIVVLTGGRARISEASHMAQMARLPLFISGVNVDATAKEVAEAAGVDPAFFDCCATLGYQAQSTHGNGLEIANWAKAKNYDALVVVTSNYHMERALLELQRAMPEAVLTGQSVASPAIHADKWWQDNASARRMLLEWFKWRVIKFREDIAD